MDSHPISSLSNTITLVDDLLSQMTLAEKVGQMTQLTNTALQIDPDINPDGSPGDRFGLDPDLVRELIRTHHIGSFLNGIAISGEDWVAFSRELQEIAIAEHRLGIPIIYGIDHMHGTSYLDNGTIFPHRSNLGATFDCRFARQEGHVIGLESADLGHHWIFAPVLDVGRNPRFPRFYETYSEEHLLCGRMGAAFIDAIENHPDTAPYKQAACAKHFVGYSDPVSGWDRSPSDISDYRLYDQFLPPFRAAIKAGVKTFMINGGEVNGEPVHGSRRLLTEVLREELGFEGVIVTDWEDVIRLHTVHKVAASPKEAVKLGIDAGIDMSMTPFDAEFCHFLIELVEEGSIPMSRIDESVRRVLTLKAELGLFDHAAPSDERLHRIGMPESKAMAREAALESMVLIKNNGVLPLQVNPESLLVSGPLANMKRAISGGWTLRWIPATDRYFPQDLKTVWKGIQDEFGENVRLADRLQVVSAGPGDVIVMVAGEEPYSEGSGNDYDARLDPEQISWIKEASATGAKVVLVLLEGRPRIITEVESLCDAIIWAGWPGFEGAEPLAGLLSGRENFSGKLPFSYPAQTGHFYCYDHKLMDLGHYQGFAPTQTHLAPFGHGLSYTTFSYSSLRLSHNQLSKEETITAEVVVTNAGDRAGKEAVLWYISDEFASLTPPVKKLRHFEKIALEPGESRVVQFCIQPNQDLGFYDGKGNLLVEPGAFTLRVGGLAQSFELLGIA